MIYYRTLSLWECDLKKPVTYKVENNRSFLKLNQKKSTRKINFVISIYQPNKAKLNHNTIARRSNLLDLLVQIW